MLKRALGVLLLACLSCALVQAQVCPATTNATITTTTTVTAGGKLICLVPQLYGANGLTLPNPFHAAHFESDFETRFTALNTAVGTELSSLRLASPASGILFTFDKTLGTVTRSTESYGPILGERAETIGLHRFYLAATYQFFPFSSLDGIDLKHIPAVFTHIDCCNPDGSPRTAASPPSPGSPLFEQEFITTTNRIDLKVHQVTLFGTFGLTKRVDVSMAVPIMDVRMGVTSDATIVRIAPPGPFGFAHFFVAGDQSTTHHVFTSTSDAAGIGDIVFRVKGTALKGERAAAAIGADVRVPTGDEKNFLGSGAAGFKPFIVASYRARVSPHFNIGYQINGSSILAGDPTTNREARLPDQLFYSGGFDVGLTKQLTAAVDLLGQRLFSAQRAVEIPYVDIVGVVHPAVTQIDLVKQSFNMHDLSLGAKYSPLGNLLLTGNLLVKLDDAGLRAKVVPLIGISYSF